jgi:hypothetical protein
VWLAASSFFAYKSLLDVFAEPSSWEYGGSPHSRLVVFVIGFMIYPGAYLCLALILLIWLELILFETVFRKS